MTTDREASEILLNYCPNCIKREGCQIKEAGENPVFTELPDEWEDGECTVVEWEDTETLGLF